MATAVPAPNHHCTKRSMSIARKTSQYLKIFYELTRDKWNFLGVTCCFYCTNNWFQIKKYLIDLKRKLNVVVPLIQGSSKSCRC